MPRLRVRPTAPSTPPVEINKIAGPQVEHAPIDSLILPNRSLRRWRAKYEEQHAANIKANVFAPFVVIAADGRVVHGAQHLAAYRLMGRTHIPVIRLDDRSEASIRRLQLWLDSSDHEGVLDLGAVKEALEIIIENDPAQLNFTGREMGEIDLVLHHDDQEAEAGQQDTGADDVAEALRQPRVTLLGDMWIWPKGHRLICANARHVRTYEILVGCQRVRLVLTDVPYGTKIKGVVSAKHGEFVEGSNKSEAEMIVFFDEFFAAMLPVVQSGAWVFTFIDWKSLYGLTTAVRSAGLEQKSLIVVDKTVASRGGLYKNQAEFIILSKWGDGPSINNVQMGKFGRSRSNIWQVAGYAGFRPDRAEALAAHSTVKPLGCLLPALLDASNVGDIVLDPFAGSGSLILAAERVKRIAYCSELDPKFVDVAVRRMHKLTGEYPVHAELGLTYPEVEALRGATAPAAQDER